MQQSTCIASMGPGVQTPATQNKEKKMTTYGMGENTCKS
jgi:hypothetical protein